jgi:hypothetical protein
MSTGKPRNPETNPEGGREVKSKGIEGRGNAE